MGWKHQTVGPRKREPQVARGPVWYPSTNSSLQISIFQIHQIFNNSYFPQFNLSVEKKYLFLKIPSLRVAGVSKKARGGSPQARSFARWLLRSLRLKKERKRLLHRLQTCPKITQKFTQNRQTVVNEMSREI